MTQIEIQNEVKSFSSIGFVTVVEGSVHGYFGGFLVLNKSARPLEFHCTVPIKTSRAQEILYGPTLKPYIYGEQIAHTLINKAAKKPQIVFTNLPEVLAVQQSVTQPVLLVIEDQSSASFTDAEGQQLESFQLSEFQLAGYPSILEKYRQRIDSLCDGIGQFDLNEPFTRICEAILEAQKTGKKAA